MSTPLIADFCTSRCKINNDVDSWWVMMNIPDDDIMFNGFSVESGNMVGTDNTELYMYDVRLIYNEGSKCILIMDIW